MTTYTTAAETAAKAAYDAAIAAYADALDAANAARNSAYAAAYNDRNAALDAAATAYAAAYNDRDATPTDNLLAAAPALLAAAKLALGYLETLTHQPSIHPSTRAQDALHDAIVAAQGLPT